ncbi:MAG: 1-deoxy-D-xylulose-5-phosphate reductoisomerase [Oscillospiraceae bacterium]|nr:1-deoxy-D-xylulose-5-phosphate reductoisomerase [Oscillospiraceae bacterium]
MTENLSILGCTGSIGTQALEVADELSIPVGALAANNNISLLEKQIRKFSPSKVCVYNEKSAGILKENIKDTFTKVYAGMDGLCNIASQNSSDTVLTAVSGMIGLIPTLEAIKSKKNIALANKEALVAGGAIVTEEAKKNGVKILPVDSEHSAIFQCIQGIKDTRDIKRLILTASGGPFFGKKLSELKNVTVQDALNHPNWSMGKKITIDSATMMNKGLEIIEAVWLFNINPLQIDVVVHRESVIHSMVEFKDNAIISQMGTPSMKTPIQYALTYPGRMQSSVKSLDFTKYNKLTFESPDYETFKCINLCRQAIKTGGTLPAAINAANEEAVALFLNGKISFLQIQEIVEYIFKNHKLRKINSLYDIIDTDKNIKEFVLKKFGCGSN